MDRRSLLAVSGTTLTALTAGCLDTFFTDDQRNYAFGLYNGSSESHSFRIRIGNELENSWFYEEALELDAGSANEEIQIGETPSRIFLQVDSTDEREFPWPASTAELGNTAQIADIWYEPTLSQDIIIYGDL